MLFIAGRGTVPGSHTSVTKKSNDGIKESSDSSTAVMEDSADIKKLLACSTIVKAECSVENEEQVDAR
ncbi:unnamed protein product [Schistosoma mattheei]|uniref:Uncharacterized protein n=1 Tax=Schistosoma mattheei TaxID=31246 RepID=A0A183PDE1_9TREM|nr:unnamed protein product [Schistosoma mattheei]